MIFDLIFFAIAATIIYLLYKIKFKKSPQNIQPKQTLQQKQPKQRPRWTRNQQQNQNQNQQQGSQEQQDEERKGFTQTQGRKAARKQQKARMKKQRQQQLQELLKQSSTKNDTYRKRVQQQQREQQQKERKLKEAMQAIAEEDRKRKEEQYKKWKEYFQVQNQGSDLKSAEELAKQKKQFEQKFLKYIRENKITLLEDIAAQFKLSTKQVVDKIKQFQNQKLINGVFDERGKYLEVTQKQWLSVLSYMKAKGRVSKAEMMSQCANIIKFEGQNKKQQQQQLLKLIEQQNQ